MSLGEISRHQVMVQGRRMHYRRSGKGPPVVLLHESPRSSAAVLPLIGYGPEDVTILAFDTPGCGDSDPLPLARPDAEDYGDAVAQALALLGIDRAVVYGTHTGAAIAIGLALRHPQRVSRLVIDGLGVFNSQERAQILESYMPPFVPLVDGTHLAWLWARVRDQFTFFPWNSRGTGARLWRPLPEPPVLNAVVLDLLRAGDNYRAPYAAAFRFQPKEALSRLRIPAFIGARTDDMLQPHLARLDAMYPLVKIAELSADRPLWGAQIWAQVRKGLVGLADAPAAPAGHLPDADGALGEILVGAPSRHIRLRGNGAGTGRPLILLHDSPGAARNLDNVACAYLGKRPVLMPDLPCHGDSTPLVDLSTAAEAAETLHVALAETGLTHADVRGSGMGHRLAETMAEMWPDRYQIMAPPDQVALPLTNFDVPSFEPRADGGHLFSAWFYARDAYILGPAWHRRAEGRHDFGDDLDVNAIHRHTVDILKESAGAPVLRAALRESRS